MSWSEGRSNESRSIKDQKDLADSIRSVNAVLLKFSRDEDFQDDLKLSNVKEAINHWSGTKRLSPEEAEKFEDDRRVMSVYPKLKTFQAACQHVKIRVPLDHLLSGKPKLDKTFLLEAFGQNFCEENGLVESSQTTTTNKGGEVTEKKTGENDSSNNNASRVPDNARTPARAPPVDDCVSKSSSGPTILEQFQQADWIEIISRIFTEQFVIAILCLAIVYYMGYLPVPLPPGDQQEK